MPTHEQCRQRVCLLCMSKTKTMRRITQASWNIIEENFIEGLDKNDDRLPCALCSTCAKVVSEYSRGIKSRHINVYDYSAIGRIITTRSTQSCSCKVCEVAQSIPENISKKVGAAAVPRRNVGRSSSANPCLGANSSSSSIPGKLLLCSTCLSVLARGCVHNCTKTSRVMNIQGLANEGTPKSKEKVASLIIHEKVQRSSDLNTSGNKNNTISLANVRGRPSVITCGVSETAGPAPKRRLFTGEDISAIQSDLDLSNTQTLRLAGHIRVAAADRHCIETNLKAVLQQRNHQLDGFFTLESKVSFGKNNPTGDDMDVVQRPFIFCNNVNGLVQEIQRYRDKSYTDIKFGIDGGGGQFKVCLTLHNFTNGDDNKSKRQCYVDGVAAKMRKDGSVKKSIIICLVPDIPENHHNVAMCWAKLALDDVMLPYTIATDLKLANILAGLMAHGSNHPCTWCDVTKTNMLKGECGALRTLGSLKSLYMNWQSAGSVRRLAKNFGNVIHNPIMKDEDTKLILDIIPPPELHLLIGPVTTMFQGLKTLWPEANRWTDLCNVEQEPYHGGVFNGNACMQLLQQIDLLVDPLSCPRQEYIAAFQDFASVVESCYGKHLSDNYEDAIKRFQHSYAKLNVRITPKIHAVFYHIKDFCASHRLGLAHWSEQAIESIHADFKKTWARYAVGCKNQRYGEQLLNAVKDYASKHL